VNEGKKGLSYVPALVRYAPLPVARTAQPLRMNDSKNPPAAALKAARRAVREATSGAEGRGARSGK